MKRTAPLSVDDAPNQFRKASKAGMQRDLRSTSGAVRDRGPVTPEQVTACSQKKRVTSGHVPASWAIQGDRKIAFSGGNKS
jgi:hypothetical protein